MSDRARLARILERIWDGEDPLAFLDEMRERHPELADELTLHREAVAVITEAVVGPAPPPPLETEEPPSLEGELGPESVFEAARNAPRQSGAAATAPSSAGARRFRVERLIGRGAMGEVYLVDDLDLRRRLAMKVMRPRDGAGAAACRSLFVSEAQITSQLDHPGVPPVHDIGTTPDGRPYFTMKLVQGRTLHDVLQDLRVARQEVVRTWDRNRLVTMLERVCETLHFAHEKGIVHRDVKPSNIMLGDFGEVQVMDWGLARLTSADADPAAVVTDRLESGLATRAGTLKGTLPYMSPEQARGEVAAVDRRTDVYALGCLLYEILTLDPAFDPADPDLLEQKIRGVLPPLQQAEPEALLAIARRALAGAPDARHVSAAAFGHELRAWMDGSAESAAKRRKANDATAEARKALARVAELEGDMREARERASALAAEVEPWRPREEKRELLLVERRVAEGESEIERTRRQALHHLQTALGERPEHADARALLADHWAEQLLDAEDGHRPARAAEAFALLRTFDDGRHAELLHGDGWLSLDSRPMGAAVDLERMIDDNGVRRLEARRSLGTTPIANVRLPMGSYRLRISHPDRLDVVYPVAITRGRTWRGTVALPAAAEIEREFAFVPGGPFRYGRGQTQWLLAAKEQTLEVGDFAIQRRPITYVEYGIFLDALAERGDLDALTHHAPATPELGPHMVRDEEGSHHVRPDLLPAPIVEHLVALHGPESLSRLPLTGVSWHDAQAYCAWRSESSTVTWRLPTEPEWEKAAVGVDGRLFPWGDADDPTLANCRGTHGDRVFPEPVGAHATAVSVYGVEDMAGNSLEWCASIHDGRQDLRTLRGGTFHAPIGWTALRFGMVTIARFGDLGFRCAHDLAPACREEA